MNEIPVARAEYLKPFIHFQKSIGASVERELNRAKLPSEMSVGMGDYLPVQSILEFTNSCARSQGIEDIGIRVFGVDDLLTYSPELFNIILNESTLKTAIESFCRLAVLEDSTIKTTLVYGEDSVHICTQLNIDVTPEQYRISEWGQNLMLISIIRLFVGSSWYPEKMAFESNAPLCPYSMELFPNTTIFIDQKSSWIEVPKPMLSLQLNNEGMNSAILSKWKSEEQNTWDLTSSITAILPSFLCDGTPHINWAAEITDMSVRTLQRRLGEEGTSFSKLVEKARFKKSIELLNMPDNKMIDIAYTVGYEDPSHFSRAFRRFAGVSPLQYRESVIMPLTNQV